MNVRRCGQRGDGDSPGVRRRRGRLRGVNSAGGLRSMVMAGMSSCMSSCMRIGRG